MKEKRAQPCIICGITYNFIDSLLDDFDSECDCKVKR